MGGDDMVAQAAAELYATDPGEFVGRRDALAARARAAGAAAAAKQIAGLRKPTRSAWVLNQLSRADPGAAGQLVGLGEQLRAAQEALDGDALRELSVRRRRLIDALARAAFAAAGLHAPPAALREEVTGTLGAALADPQVAAQLQAGALERAARREGFGSAAPPVLTLVPAARRSGEPSHRSAGPGRGGRSDGSPAGSVAAPSAAQARRAATSPGQAAAGPGSQRRAGVTTLAGARAKADAQRRRHAVAAAQQQLAEAGADAAAAAEEQQEAEHAVRLLEVQLADARQRLAAARDGLAEARMRGRQAAAAQRRARQALDRLQD